MKTRKVLIVTDDGQFELSVNPKEISISQDNKDKTIDLLNIGEVSVLGNRGLMKTTISTFLPGAGSPFYSGTDPAGIIAMMKKAKNGKKMIRLIVSGTDINALFSINNMSEQYVEGQQDINVSWTLVEYRNLNTSTVASLTARYTDTGVCSRGTGTAIPKTVTVKSGDTLWNLAKRYYDDGSRWVDIARQNNIEGDEDLKIGMILVMPA